MHGSSAQPSQETSTSSAGLGLLFGLLYFIQGVGEPTEGLVAQPVRSMMREWGLEAGQIAMFAGLLALPWWLKPVYGLLSDFVPIRGSRRRSYLIATSAIALVSFLTVYFFPVPQGAAWLLFLALLLPTAAIACSDVVIDALLIEKAQPTGTTGSLQAVQWTAMWTATILAGFLGGYLCQHGMQSGGFLVCGLLALGALYLSIAHVREPRRRDLESRRERPSQALRDALKNQQVLLACAFLFLWNFNPFSSTVLYLHMTDWLGMSEQMYGNSVSVMAFGALLASAAYGLYCRKVPFSLLLNASVLCGVLSTIAYLALRDTSSAMILSLAVGFFHMTGTMVQLDLAARACPVKAAGTVFALIMAISNISVSLATWLGGGLYEHWTEQFGADTSFSLLVTLAALVGCSCWFLVPTLTRDEALPGVFGPLPEVVEQRV